MADARSVDIAVVGGGLAGLATAVALARAGRSVALVAPAHAADRRTTALLGESVAFIRSLGAWDAVAAEAQPLRAIRIVDATGRILRAPEVLFDAAELGIDAFGHNVPNTALLAALEAEANTRGVVRCPTTAAAIELDDTKVAIRGADGSMITARLCVGADGRNSTVRVAAGIALHAGRPSGQAALACSLDHAIAHDDVSTEFHTPHGPFTLVPLPGLRSGLVWVTEAAEAERLKSLPPYALAEAIERHAASILGRMSLAGPAQTFPLTTASAARLAGKRTALVGESAHVLPPIAAQGFNLTLRDIGTLARLAGAAADPGSSDVLDGYDRERRADLGLRAAAVSLLNRSLLTGFVPIHAARSAGLLALSMIPPLRRAVMRQGLGLP